MKAIICAKYGKPDVLQVKEIEMPKLRDNEILIKVFATSVTTADCMMRRADTLSSRLILGLTKPKKTIQGLELAGEIETIGKQVTHFKKGDLVFGFTGFSLGAYAEFCCLPEKASVAEKPINMSFEEAAAIVDGATTALFFLRDKGKIKKGQKVLIIGASGGIGTSSVQLAKYFGAEVTGVCSTSNVDLVKSLGADMVIDYTKEDFTKSGKRYDIIFDTVSKSSFSNCKNSLSENGCYLVTVMSFTRIFQTLLTRIIGSKRVIFALSIEKSEALRFIKKLIEEGKLKSVIDRRYTMEQISDAHSYVEIGHKKGNVVISIK
jgi:NADPH:quinone reductase-like Zn-dependent oxidoreductase